MLISQKLVFVGFMTLIDRGSLTQLVVAIILAVAYLVWKLGLQGRRPKEKGGPDVPASRLVKSARRAARERDES